LGANRREKFLPPLVVKNFMSKIFDTALTKQKFVEHKIASAEAQGITAIKFEYLLAGNGLFIRAKRREFSVCLALWRGVVKNLPIAASGIVWHKPQIPAAVWQEILDTARRASFPTISRKMFLSFSGLSRTANGSGLRSAAKEAGRGRLPTTL
jgi:hypothetical protein